MLTFHQNGTFSFSIFSKFPQILCSMSTRRLGDLNVGRKPLINANKLLSLYDIPLCRFIAMRQIHGSDVNKVTVKEGGSLVEGADGLISSDAGIFLGVKTADCVPLFFYNPKKRIIAVVHAGWKGILESVAVRAVEKMEKMGADPQEIFVGIGPHIGKCCYIVPRERSEAFTKSFKDSIVLCRKNQWFLDLGQAVFDQLVLSGIKPDHIERSDICTSCRNDLFFSFRKDKKETYGEMLGIIGMKTN